VPEPTNAPEDVELAWATLRRALDDGAELIEVLGADVDLTPLRRTRCVRCDRGRMVQVYLIVGVPCILCYRCAAQIAAAILSPEFRLELTDA
jgi:hypothetical protein